MKCFWFWIAFLVACNFLPGKEAAAQSPYHCDSLKLTFFNTDKIQVRFFQVEKTCPATCTFCRAIEKEDWLQVETQLKRNFKTLDSAVEPFGILRSQLLVHRMVNFVLPPDPEAQTKKQANLIVGFQVPYMTYTWNAVFKLKKATKNNPLSWKFTSFEDYHQIYSHLNNLANEFSKHLQSDSLQKPLPLLPDQNYLAAWFGTRNLSREEITRQETQIRKNPRQVVKEMVEAKDGLGLVILMGHQNLAVRYLALNGIKKIRDKNSLSYLLRLTEYTINNPHETTPETSVLYSNFCEQLVSTIGTLTNSSFNRCPFAHYGAQHYLSMGLPDWERKVDHRFGQGIGSYATIELGGK